MRRYIVQLLIVATAIILVVAAGLVQEPARRARYHSEQMNRGDRESSPDLALMTVMPGAVRAVALSILWSRMQSMHQEGRHHDAYELSRLICKLEPYYPGAWAYCGWNMAWNVSVETHTKEERWQWVYNGIKLLRDEGLRRNPRDIVFYYELGWIFSMKLGGRLDNYHWSYKQRWAKMMQDLLGAPQLSDRLDITLAESSAASIEAFRPVADAPLDKTPRRQGNQLIQSDKLAVIRTEDPDLSAFIDALGAHDISPDESFLDACNRLSSDYQFSSVRINRRPYPKEEREKELYDLINAPAYTETGGEDGGYAGWDALSPFDKLVSFIRAQVLWNRYRMDPDYMLTLMERYQVPLDWRHSVSHGLYWYCLGMDRCRIDDPTDYKSLRIQRNVLNSLKTLTFTGLVELTVRPGRPEYPEYHEHPDLRFIVPTHRQHCDFIEWVLDYQKKHKDYQDEYEDNTFAAGHYNYISSAVSMLYADGRRKLSQELFDFVKEHYDPDTEKEWDEEVLDYFVIAHLKEHKKAFGFISALIEISMKRAFLAAGVREDWSEYNRRMTFAVELYGFYQKDAVSNRLIIPKQLRGIARGVAGMLVFNPESAHLNLSPSQRSDVYLAALSADRKLGEPPGILAPLYHHGLSGLRALCRRGKMKMEEAFPEPPFLAEYRETLKSRIPDTAPTDGDLIDQDR